MTVTVWKITKYDVGKNSHTVSRQEEWSMVPIETVEDEKTAIQYVKDQERYNSEFIILAGRLTDSVRDDFLHTFVTDDMYLFYRTYMFGSKKEVEQAIRQSIINRGVKLI